MIIGITDGFLLLILLTLVAILAVMVIRRAP
jgi:hypothetical protein